MSAAVRALRGATTLDEDTPEHMVKRVTALLTEMFARNDVVLDDVISVICTATPDIHSMFPAAAAREFGLGDVPLLGASEIEVDGATPLCVRIMIHVGCDHPRSDIRHVYLEGASNLRSDLPE